MELPPLQTPHQESEKKEMIRQLKVHELKIQQDYYENVFNGRKTFELRKNDRGFQVGDLIQFRVLGKNLFGLDNSILTPQLYVITYILENVPEYGLDKEYCILGIKRAVIKEVE